MNSTNKKIAEDLGYKICAIAFIAEDNKHLKGATEALDYRYEFMNQLFPLIDFDEDVIFVNAKKFSDISKTCTIFFAGKYVNICRKTDWTGYHYFAICAAPSNLKTCYLKAREIYDF